MRSEVAIKILGPLEVVVGGRQVAFRRRKTGTLLIALALHANVWISGERLQMMIWEDPPQSAAANLRNYLADLRAALDVGSGVDGARLGVVAGAVRLHVEPVELDLLQYRESVAAGRDAATRGDRMEAVGRYQDALALWRGTVTAGLTVGASLANAISRLNESRVSCVEELAEVRLALGEHSHLVGDLRAVVDEFPYRERAWAALMKALYRSGDSAGALAAYRQVERQLREDLGIAPGTELTDLHAALLRRSDHVRSPSSTNSSDFGVELRRRRTGQVRALADLASVTHYSKAYLSKIENGHQVPTEDLASACDTALGAGGALVTLAGSAVKRSVNQEAMIRPAQLPATTRSFTGRARELQQLDAALAFSDSPAAPLAMLVGSAGCGKTALAIHWAHRAASRYPDGIIFVDLHGYADAAARAATDVLVDFLRTLGVSPAALPVASDARAAMFRSMTAKRRMLIVLDNAASSGQVLPLLPGTPTCHTLVTSRANLPGLAVHGGLRIRIGPLPEAEAVELLRRTIGPARVNAEPQAALTLVRDCACLPLVLRIAADWTTERPQLTLRQVVQRLMTSPDRLDLLATDGPHGTMRSVFSWSYASLPDTAARAFRRLGHHPGPDISLAAASALLGCPNATARAILGVLTGVHLLTEKDIDRYEFHDLLREYARECAEADEASAARTAAADRILTWYLLTARNGANRLSPGSPPYVVISAPPDCHPQDFASASEALAWFETERANLVAAVTEARRSGRSDIAWQLAVSISPFLYQHGHWDDWISTQEVGLAAAEEQGDDMAEARMLSGLGGALGELHRYEPAKRLLERALSIRRRLNDRSGAAYVLANLATLDRDLGCLDTAIHRLQEVEATFRADLDDFGLTYTLINIGELYLAGNELNAARTALTEAVELSRKHHNYFAEGCALDFLGRVHSRTGDLDGAELLLSKALTIRLDLDDRRGAATTLAHLAQVHELAGNLRKADHCRRRARALAEFLGHSSPVETNAEYAKPLTHPLRPGYNALRSAVVIRHGDGP